MCFLDARAWLRGHAANPWETHGRVSQMLRKAYCPQQLARPNVVSLLSTPFIALSVISVTPVSL
jgi:hypothetical protein